MDYDTFINSAFIVQGRADEFTQKSARQRKEILSSILGLGRYDRLQELARQHLQDRAQKCQAHRRRLEELDAELVPREEYEAQRQEVAARLEELRTGIADDEAALERLRQNRLERQRLQQECAAQAREEARLRERRQALEKEQEYFRTQQQKDDEILATAAAIERDYSTYQEVQLRIGQLRRQLQQLRELENRRAGLQQRIDQARHQVEQRCALLEAQCQDGDRRLQDELSLLDKEQTIAARYELMQATRQQDQALEKERLRHEALGHEQLRLEQAIALEEQSLLRQRDDSQRRLEEVRQRLQQARDQEKHLEELERTIAALIPQAAERDRLRDEGTALRAQVEEQKRQLEVEQERLKQEHEKIHLLRTADSAQCPLCGSRLDEQHRLRLDQEMARRQREQLARLDQQQQNIAHLESSLRDMRARYMSVEKQTAPLEELQNKRAALEVCRHRAQEFQEEAEQLARQFAGLTEDLENQRYAPELRHRLRRVADELAQLAYQAGQHAQVKKTLESLLPVEAEYLRLQDARCRADQLRGELQEVQAKRALARQQLDQGLYAQQEQRDLQEVQSQIHALGYDPAAHQDLDRRLDELSDVMARRERLQAARQRRADVAQTIARHERELTHLQQELGKIVQHAHQLEERSRALEGVEQQCADLEERLSRARAEKDHLLPQHGSLQDKCDRCAQFAAEREQLQRQLDEDQREAWIYEKLSEAFGKDGIQALIIESAIPEIEREANAILARLTDNRIQIAIESLRDLKGGGTRETLDIKIADEIGERSYHLYSGGEAFRTSFALRIALSKVLAMRAGTRLRTLIIDEGFGTQDGQGLEQLVEAIQEISRDFDKVLVVTHLSELKKAFPVQIEVTKHPDLGSRFEVVYNA
jgi:exonuclease SbcC